MNEQLVERERGRIGGCESILHVVGGGGVEPFELEGRLS